jgi:hypothetical protein
MRLKRVRRALIGIGAVAVVFVMQATPAHADWDPGPQQYHRYTDHVLCGDFYVFGGGGRQPIGDILVSRRVNNCSGSLPGGYAGGLGVEIVLIQDNSVYGPIICGRSLNNVASHQYPLRVENTGGQAYGPPKPCPLGQNWRIRATVYGQLYDRYFYQGERWEQYGQFYA